MPRPVYSIETPQASNGAEYTAVGKGRPLRWTFVSARDWTAWTWSPNGNDAPVGVLTWKVESETEIRRIGSSRSLLPGPNRHALVVPHGVFTAE